MKSDLSSPFSSKASVFQVHAPVAVIVLTIPSADQGCGVGIAKLAALDECLSRASSIWVFEMAEETVHFHGAGSVPVPGLRIVHFRSGSRSRRCLSLACRILQGLCHRVRWWLVRRRRHGRHIASSHSAVVRSSRSSPCLREVAIGERIPFAEGPCAGVVVRRPRCNRSVRGQNGRRGFE